MTYALYLQVYGCSLSVCQSVSPSVMMATLCAVVAALSVIPNRSQFFQYESVSLSCGQPGNSAACRVKRNTTSNINEEVTISWERINESHLLIDALYPLDTGTYWCESAAGECSDAVDIFVTAGPVILESPVLPVTEGDDVTLRCRTQTTFATNLTADFYKDGLLVGSGATGNITVPAVSRSDEGLYRCDVSGAGGSLESWLTVRVGRHGPPNDPQAGFLLPVVGACLSLVLLVSLVLMYLWRKHKGKVDPDVSYVDVTIAQAAPTSRTTDVAADPTFYSTVKPGNT